MASLAGKELNLSDALKEFNQVLDDLSNGEKKCSLQIKDLDLFRAIKYKIENYPLLKEIFDQTGFKKRRPRYVDRSASRDTSSKLKSRNSVNGSDNLTSTANLGASNSQMSEIPKRELGGLISPKGSDSNRKNPFFLAEDPKVEPVFQNELMVMPSNIRFLVQSSIAEVKEIIKHVRKISLASYGFYGVSKKIIRLIFEAFANHVFGSEAEIVRIFSKSSSGKWVQRFHEPIEETENSADQFKTAEKSTPATSPASSPRKLGLDNQKIFKKLEALLEKQEFEGVSFEKIEGVEFRLVTMITETLKVQFVTAATTSLRYYLLESLIQDITMSKDKQIRQMVMRLFQAIVDQQDCFAHVDSIEMTVFKLLNSILTAFHANGGAMLNYLLMFKAQAAKEGWGNHGVSGTNVQPNLKVHLEGTLRYSQLTAHSNLFLREASTQFIFFPEYGFILELPNSDNIAPLEIYFTVKECMSDFTVWLNDNLARLNTQWWLKHDFAMKMMIHMDLNRFVSDMSGCYFPGQSRIMNTPFTFDNLNLKSDVKLDHLLKLPTHLELFQATAERVLQTKKHEEFDIGDFKMSLHLEEGIVGNHITPKGFTLVINRNSRHTLPFMVAKKLVKQEDKIEKWQATTAKAQNSKLVMEAEVFHNIISAKSLKEVVHNFMRYIRDEYHISDDDIVEIVKKENMIQVFHMMISAPPPAISLYSEYFAQVRNPRKTRKNLAKLTEGVISTIHHKKLFGRQGSLLDGLIDHHHTVKEKDYDKDIELLKSFEMSFLGCPTLQMFRFAHSMFKHVDAVEEFQIQEPKFYTFMAEVQRLYDHRSNPFHNFKHGMSVMHSVYFLVKYTKCGNSFDKLAQAALVFAGIMHDIDHTGVNNTYEMNSSSELAIRYNDVSILENHHCSTAFSILQQEKFSIFSNFNFSTRVKFRKVVIAGILATDVKHHFPHLEKFKDKLDKNQFNPVPENEIDYQILIGQILHTSDLYVPTKPLPDAVVWCSLINQEFMNQNAAEKEHGLPETPFYKNLDRPEVVSKSEKFFVGHLVMPLWTELDKYTEGALDGHMKNIKTYLKHWEDEVNKHSAPAVEVPHTQANNTKH